MFCERCGKEIPAESRYCMHCGKMQSSKGPEKAKQKTPLLNVDTWFLNPEIKENYSEKEILFARAYQYILGLNWGKGKPIPWLDKLREKERDKREVKNATNFTIVEQGTSTICGIDKVDGNDNPDISFDRNVPVDGEKEPLCVEDILLFACIKVRLMEEKDEISAERAAEIIQEIIKKDADNAAKSKEKKKRRSK